MKPTAPVNIDIMNVDKYVRDNLLQEVTSLFMYEPSSTAFHPYGLYSEIIFGQLGSTDRLSKLGYIDLHTTILSPLIYKNITDVVSYYDDLMKGIVYCIWNDKEKRFDIVAKDFPNARTGYSFFLEHFSECHLIRNNSVTRNNKIGVIEKAIKNGTYITDKMLVCPAGWRDVKVDATGHVETEDVNKLYASLIAVSKELEHLHVQSEMLTMFVDNMKYSLQLKCFEIYTHWKTLLEGKSGFGQAHYSKRAIASGTRNVITASTLEAESPDDPTFIKADETVAPLYQTAKDFEDLVCYYLNTVFYAPIYTMGSVNIPAINPNTQAIEYVEVSAESVTDALSTANKSKFISNFEDTKTRHRPVAIKDVRNKVYYLWMVYDTGKEIYVYRNLNDLATMLGIKEHGITDELNTEDIKAKLNKEFIRPLTNIEMLYLATMAATKGKHATVTRYPAIEVGSIYPTKIVVATTTPDRVVTFKSQYTEGMDYLLPHYPIYQCDSYADSLVIHPAKTPGLNADHDGDTCSLNSIMTIEANRECADYLNQAKSMVSVTGKFFDTVDTKSARLVIHALTRLPNNVTLPSAE